jgi:adenosine deaminase
LHYLSGKKYPFNPWAEHHKQIINWFGDVHRDIVEKFSITTGVMQSPITIHMAAEEFVVYLARKGFTDIKGTIAPQYHVFGDKYTKAGMLKEKDVMDIFVAGLKDGIKRAHSETGYKVRARLLWGIGREVSSQESERFVRIASECDREFVPGITLVCNEPNNPPEKHLSAFQLARELGLEDRRCHVEWVKDRTDEEKNTPEKIERNYRDDIPQLRKNLETAIFKMQVSHIDHAFSLCEHDDLIEEVVKRNIGITNCPGSMLFTKLISDVKSMKIKKLLKAGVRLSIDCDDDLFMMNLDEVMELCNDRESFTAQEISTLSANA